MSHITVQKGVDDDGNVQPIGATGVDSNAFRTLGEQDFNLPEILQELRIIRKHLELLTDAEFKDDNVEK